MHRTIHTIAAATLLTVFAAGGIRAQSAEGQSDKIDKTEFYSFTIKDIDGKDKSLSDFKGKVVLIVNTASKCGFTPQYESLEGLYQKYRNRGFAVLAFPANDFRQEPGTNEEIKRFCAMKYNITFNLFSKISVKGSEIHPLFAWLTTQDGVSGGITWNFNKFLIDKNGNAVARFDSKIDPMSEEITQKIEALLMKK
jgi:glutathione peroxidase